jgi:hypothetical protein
MNSKREDIWDDYAVKQDIEARAGRSERRAVAQQLRLKFEPAKMRPGTVALTTGRKRKQGTRC